MTRIRTQAQTQTDLQNAGALRVEPQATPDVPFDCTGEASARGGRPPRT